MTWCGRADFGHIFAFANGGSNTLDNGYMQEHGFNVLISNFHDELNAALVGYERTERALQDSRKFGGLDFDKLGIWAGWTSEDIVDLGKARFAAVGCVVQQPQHTPR